jgi:hypothetical protein
MKTKLVMSALLAWLWLWAPALADSTGAYDGVLRQALDEFERGNWIEARAYFERAHALQPSARTLRAIGLCAFEEKQYVLAATTLQQALEHAEKPLDARQRKEVSDTRARAESFIVRYTLELTPADARVEVDGAAPSLDGAALRLDPGRHDIVVSADGYQSAQRAIVAQPNMPGSLRVALEPKAAAQRASAQPEAPPVEPPSAAPTQAHEPQLTTLQLVGIGVGVAGVLSLGASLYFTLDAASTYDESGCADGGCRDEAALALNREALDAGNIATVTAIAGLVAVGAGAVLFFAGGAGDEESGAQLSFMPVVAPTRVGLELGGRY